MAETSQPVPAPPSQPRVLETYQLHEFSHHTDLEAQQTSTRPLIPPARLSGQPVPPPSGTFNINSLAWDDMPRLGMLSLERRVKRMSLYRRAYLRVVTTLGLRRASPFPQECARVEFEPEGKCYAVVGFMNRASGVPTETVVVYGDQKPGDGGGPNTIRKGIKVLRGYHRYFFSPRVVTKLELYECVVTNSSHRIITLDERKQKLMDQLFREYQLDRDPHIREWIMKNLTEHNLAISLRLGWSPVRVACLVLLPLLLSLIVGFWYMIRFDDAQTAWTIASYIVTASGVVIALISVVAFMA